MENNRIMRLLAVILLIACGIVAVTLVRINYNMDYVSSDAVDDLVAVMEKDGVRIDRNIISRKRENGTVYVFDSDGYAGIVAQLLSGSAVKETYAVPDGELILLENGDRCEFGENFTFRYQAKDADSFSPNIMDLRQYAVPALTEKEEVIVEAVQTFLDNGSRSFEESGLNVEVVVDEIWNYAGISYVLCSRKIDDVEITGNLVLCTVEKGKVTAAYGTFAAARRFVSDS